jgi:hypothetical protein
VHLRLLLDLSCAYHQAASTDARSRLDHLVRSIFNTALDPRDTRIKSGAQVVQSQVFSKFHGCCIKPNNIIISLQLFEALSLATGMELTALRLERAADFHILSLFATQLQRHQLQCETTAEQGELSFDCIEYTQLFCSLNFDIVCHALRSLEVVCENLKGDKLQSTLVDDSVKKKTYTDNL